MARRLSDCRPLVSRPAATALLVLAGALVLTLSGCSTDGNGLMSRWRTAFDPAYSSGLKRVEETDDRGMMARWLSPGKGKASDPNGPSSLIVGPRGWAATKVAPDPQADAEFQQAEKLFQQGKLDEAEPAFKNIARKRKDSPWGEKAQYYLAETQYQRGRFVDAHTSYEKLMAEYPGSKYLENAVKREYAIAQKWQAQDDPKAKPEDAIPWWGRFNRQRPLLDTHGSALAVLDHVRMHDPQGPLADDAVMQIADFHFANANYEEASLHYDQLISDHPKSPFLQRAQLASIDSKLKGYLGPEYDGAGLEQAREMVKRTLATFPDRSPETNEALYHTLDVISEQQAERTFTVAEYYKRIKKTSSAEYYFAMIPHRWPNSTWAPKAKDELAQLAKMPRQESLPSRIMSLPGSYDPFSTAISGGTGLGGMGMSQGGMNGMGMGGMGAGAPGGMY